MNDPAAAWEGTIYVGPSVALFRGRGAGSVAQHRVPAHKVLVGRALCRPAAGDQRTHAVLATPAGVDQQIVALGGLLVVYLDARRFSFDAASALARRWETIHPGALPEAPTLLEDIERLPRRVVDRRAIRAVDAFAQGDTLPQVARAQNLSASRLTHLVAEALGAPPQTWRTWFKLQRAVDRMAEGATATQSALEAEFSDSAHFSRVCRATLGLTPRVLRQLQIERSPLVDSRATPCLGDPRTWATRVARP